MTLTVADLVTVFGPMVAVVMALMRYQHVDSTKMHKLIADSSRENRELIEKNHQETRELIKETNQETRELIKDNRELIKENRELIEKNHQELSGGLNEVRSSISKLGERVARIEGHLKLWPSPPTPPEDGDAQPA